MLEIKDTDIMWRWYKRAYKGNVPDVIGEYYIPMPTNLCGYFWSAMKGAVLEIVWDANAFFSLMFLWISTGLLILAARYSGIYSITNLSECSYFYITYLVMEVVFLFPAIIFMSVLSVLMPFFHWFDYWSKRNETVCNISAFCIGGFIMTSIISMSLANTVSNWQLWHFFAAFLIELACLSLIALVVFVCYLFSDSTSVGKATWAYINAVKNRVCPLVKPPESYWEEKRAAETNCGDG